MATKTISLALDAYNRLRAARKHPRESFSSVLRRARWADDEPMVDGASILAYYRNLQDEVPEFLLADDVLETLEKRSSMGRSVRSESRWEE